MRGREKLRLRLSAFTLIELLVVISILVLLMAILLPVVHKARKQAQAVACQARLRQWALILHYYTTENEGWFFRHGPQTYGRASWWAMLAPYCDGAGQLATCPAKAVGPYAKMHGGYGMNGYLIPFTSQEPLRVPGMSDRWSADTYWGPLDAVRQHHAVPVLLDCHWWTGGLFCYPISQDSPPLYEGCTPALETMESLCVPWHGDFVNALFLDWSVRRVRLKELWTLRWSREFDRIGPWTKAGGAEPGDWPQWMRHFRDY